VTLVDRPRIEKLKEFLDMTKHLRGLHAEVGVYKGGTAKVIAEHAPNTHLFLFDTFAGMPETGPEDLHSKGDFNDTSLEAVKAYVNRSNVSYHKGLFPIDTCAIISKMKFSFVHLDCDIYSSVKESLDFFWPRMVKGGIIALDDYMEPNCPGAMKAVHEFLDEHCSQGIFSICQSQAAIIKE